MSSTISLVDDTGNPVTVERHNQGTIMSSSGYDVAEITYTWNYGPMIVAALHCASNYVVRIGHPDFGKLPYNGQEQSEKGFQYFEGKTGAESIPLLEAAVKAMWTNVPTENYWDPSPGNVGYFLDTLLTWAKQYPDAKFKFSN